MGRLLVPELADAKFWVPLRLNDDRPRGELLVSMQLVPASALEELPAGSGRSKPNANPPLPKPLGRLKFSLNPFRMGYRLLGRKVCRRLSACVCCLLVLGLVAFSVPTILGNVVTYPVLDVLTCK